MKFVIFKFRDNRFVRKNNQNINIERLLFLSVVAAFVLMLVVQAALISPNVRAFINGRSASYGVPLEQEEYLYSEGQIELKLLSDSTNENLKVLINGDEASSFSQGTIQLSVKNGDVVEIDASASSGTNEVEIVSKSPNVVTDCLGKKISVKENVKPLVKLKVSDK